MVRNSLIYRFVYSDGSKMDKGFSSKKQVADFAHGEGDHLVRFFRVDRK